MALAGAGSRRTKKKRELAAHKALLKASPYSSWRKIAKKIGNEAAARRYRVMSRTSPSTVRGYELRAGKAFREAIHDAKEALTVVNCPLAKEAIEGAIHVSWGFGDPVGKTQRSIAKKLEDKFAVKCPRYKIEP